MMQREYVQDLSKLVGQEVTLRGWLYNKRSSGKIQFELLRDGTGTCQCVVVKNVVGADTFAAVDALGQESALAVTGTVQATPKAPGGYELAVTKIEIISQASEYPITPKEHGVEYLMEHRHLWLRSSRPWATMRIRDTLIVAIRNFFHERGFICFDAPILTPNAAEGTSTLFETKYFEEGMAYLSQSGQLYGEAGAMAFGKVYVFGPTFRAERSKTKRHLNEFWMVEPEVAFMDLEGDMQLAEEFVHYIIGRVLAERPQELLLLRRKSDDQSEDDILKPLKDVLQPFVRISYEKAAKILEAFWKRIMTLPDFGERFASGFKPFQYGDDFGAPDEVALTKDLFNEVKLQADNAAILTNILGDAPVIVHHYPASVKAFYMKRDPNEPDKALAMDVLFPEFGEIIGGSQREDDLDELLKRIEEHQLPKAAFEWYLDLRRYGSVPHAGFGLGLERLVMWVCDLDHIREAIPFPRTLTRIWP